MPRADWSAFVLSPLTVRQDQVVVGASPFVHFELEHQLSESPRCDAGGRDAEHPVSERRVLVPCKFVSHVVTESISFIPFVVSLMLAGARQSQLATAPCREQVPLRYPRAGLVSELLPQRF